MGCDRHIASSHRRFCRRRLTREARTRRDPRSMTGSLSIVCRRRDSGAHGPTPRRGRDSSQVASGNLSSTIDGADRCSDGVISSRGTQRMRATGLRAHVESATCAGQPGAASSNRRATPHSIARAHGGRRHVQRRARTSRLGPSPGSARRLPGVLELRVQERWVPSWRRETLTNAGAAQIELLRVDVLTTPHSERR